MSRPVRNSFRRRPAVRLLAAGKWDELHRGGLKVRDLQERAGVGALPDQSDRYPLRYQVLAVDALDNGLITEGRFAQFLELSRIAGRRQADLLRRQANETSQDSSGQGVDLGEASENWVSADRA